MHDMAIAEQHTIPSTGLHKYHIICNHTINSLKIETLRYYDLAQLKIIYKLVIARLKETLD